jgi:hypothetical protein
METISPWANEAKAISPDGKFIAEIVIAREIAMGSPSVGLLQISNGMKINNCNTSMVWSSDSNLLAVPQWSNERRITLLIINAILKKIKKTPEIYGILKLEQFENGIIIGKEDPDSNPTEFEYDTNFINWELIE